MYVETKEVYPVHKTFDGVVNPLMHFKVCQRGQSNAIALTYAHAGIHL